MQKPRGPDKRENLGMQKPRGSDNSQQNEENSGYAKTQAPWQSLLYPLALSGSLYPDMLGIVIAKYYDCCVF